jgi:hydrogenase maturation factor HypF (carbamoyltransferase family)
MVLRLGSSLALTGWVRNRIGGVELDLVGERRQLEHVLELLPEALPPAARLESIEVTWSSFLSSRFCSASRLDFHPDHRHTDVGFRVCCLPQD